jgi:parallel beta-helix repeat protein
MKTLCLRASCILLFLILVSGFILPGCKKKTPPLQEQGARSASAQEQAAKKKEFLVGRDYQKIQDAINAAESGDIVRIKPGSYDESLTLKDGVNLIGEDGNNVVIKCDMRISPVLAINKCKNVHISRLTLKHYDPMQMQQEDAADGKWPVVQIDDSSATLNHLIVCDSASQGIKITNGRKNYDLVSVIDCKMYNNRSTGISVTGNGNAELKNNICANNKKSGIYFKEDADGRVSGNLCKNNAYGISIQDNAVVEASANICCENKCNGIWFDSKSPFNVSDNNCFGNGTTGIEINSQIRVSAVGNSCRRNGINGICFRNGVSGIVSENICADNKWHGISIDKYSRPNVDNNKCFNNKKCGIYDDGGMLGQNKTYNNNEFNWQEVHMYLRTEDFDKLEKMVSLIRNEKRHFSNGHWQLSHFYYSFGCGFGQQRFDDNIKLIEKWISKYPASVTPRIALAKAIDAQAWDIRGKSFSDTVSPTAWEPFEQHLSKALDVLKEAEKLNVKDPALYTEWISAATGLHKMDDIETAFKKGIAIEPTYYPLYDEHCWAYLPRWYGKPGQYEQLAREAAESTKNEIGQSLYFLLACRMTHSVRGDVNQFRELGFDYKRFKQGQQDFAKQFPDFKNTEFLNQACFMACAAGDKEDAKDYFIDIGDQWQQNVWKDAETFNKYKSWAKSKGTNEDR